MLRSPVADAATIFEGRYAENETKLLRAMWKLGQHSDVCFISIDVEGPFKAITELGLVSQRRNDHRNGMHFIVDSTQNFKIGPPKPCGFGITSTHVNTPAALGCSLETLFARQLQDNDMVVLTGYDVKNDLIKLGRDCDWLPPQEVVILDTAIILRTLTGRKNWAKLERAIVEVGLDFEHHHFHNAVNDAWYSLELLFRKAEQIEAKTTVGESTINWQQPPTPPRCSPEPDPSASAADYALRLFMPSVAGQSNSPPPPHRGWSPPPHTSANSAPFVPLTKPAGPRNKKRQKRRAAAMNDSSLGPSDARPTKRRKLQDIRVEVKVNGRTSEGEESKGREEDTGEEGTGKANTGESQDLERRTHGLRDGVVGDVGFCARLRIAREGGLLSM